MSSVVLTGDTSGAGTITVPAVAGTFTATIGSATGTHYPFTAGTAVASTSGTSIDFTSIPSWVKRITVMLSGVSISSSTPYGLIQIGSGSVTSTGYVCTMLTNGSTSNTFTAGFGWFNLAAASDTSYGTVVLTNLGSNVWVASGALTQTGTARSIITAGGLTLGGALDRVRVTTSNGTDTFDAGSINILYE